MWYSFSFWLPEEKARIVFNKLGYNVETVRCYLKREFGYKNGQAIIDDLHVKPSFLNARLVYKDSEIPELNRRLGILLGIVREAEPNKWWMKNINVLGHAISRGYDIRDTVAWFEMKHRFRKVLEELLEIDPRYD